MNDNFTVNETTEVSFVYGVATEITFEDLIKVMSTSDSYFEDIHEYVEDIIEDLNNSGVSEFFDGEYFRIIELEYDNGKKEKTLLLESDYDEINKDGILENILNEEFVKLSREQFWLDVKDYEKSFVFTDITVNKHENLRFFTRNDWYSDLKPLKSKNIIPSNELKDITKYFYDGEKVIRDAKKITGHMFKKDFNPEKWWLGWNIE